MKKQNNWLLIGAGALVAVIAFAGAAAMFNHDEDEKTLKSSAYEIARLDDTTGKADDSDDSGISTKEYHELAQLISIEAEDGVTWYLNAYNEDKTFIQVDEYTGDLTAEDLAAYENLGAKYYKIEIVDDEDDEISWLEKGALAKKVTVTYSTVEAEAEAE